MNKEEGLKIISAKVENFKNIDHRIIEANGASFAIIGKNGKGKSSLMQALMSAFDGRMVSEHVIKNGEEKASVRVRIAGTIGGQPEEYDITIRFNEKHKKGDIEVRNMDGEVVKGGKQFLRSMVGNVSFDVFEFIRRGKTADGKPSLPGQREQVSLVKTLLPDAVREELGNISVEYKEKYDERTLVNRETERLFALVNSSAYTQDEINEYAEPKPMDIINEELKKVSEQRAKRAKVVDGIAQLKVTSERLERQIIESSAEIDMLRKKIDEIEKQQAIYITQNKEVLEKVRAGNEWLKKNPEVETDIEQRVNEINEHNAKHEQIKLYLEAYERAEKSKNDGTKLTEELKKLDDRKSALTSSAELPVPGLSFDDDRIYYNGLPFDETSQPKSTIIGVGMKIAMALNPSLKVVTIPDGSLLDDESLDMIIRMAQKYGYQVIIELVSDDQEVKIEYYEDDIAGPNNEPAAVAEPKKKSTKKKGE